MSYRSTGSVAVLLFCLGMRIVDIDLQAARAVAGLMPSLVKVFAARIEDGIGRRQATVSAARKIHRCP